MKNGSTQYILTINSGSSSLKFALYNEETLAPELAGEIGELRKDDPHMTVKDKEDKVIISHAVRSLKLATAESEIIGFLHKYRARYPVCAIGHRIVQGGPEHRCPEMITSQLLKTLHELTYLAPNHLPAEIELIKKFGEAFPQAVQVACFDTFFHRDLPDEARNYALPAEYREKGLIRYGFHGLSYEHILDVLKKKYTGIVKRKIIIAHLGSGASMAAVAHGTCIDTTMGISPLGGLVMSTRPGDLDPGVLLFLLQQHHLTVSELEDLLSHHSGLKAMTGTADMRQLIARTDCAEATAAIALFCYQAKKQIGAFAAAMGGLDMLVFTGGIGENSAVIREKICSGLNFLGVELNQRLNYCHHKLISADGAPVKVHILSADEAVVIARHTQQIIHQKDINKLT